MCWKSRKIQDDWRVVKVISFLLFKKVAWNNIKKDGDISLLNTVYTIYIKIVYGHLLSISEIIVTKEQAALEGEDPALIIFSL